MAYTRIIENLTLNDTLDLIGPEWNNTLVRNVIIENVSGDGIMLRDVSNVRIENVTIRNVSGDGIKLSTLGSTSDVVLHGNKISNIGDDGINAGQREDTGVDHPGLKVIGNTVDNTGLNAGTTGLIHGIYVQSTDFLIEGNRVTTSTDGNGISVRSSGIVRDNYIETSRESGIAYYADHGNGPSDTLVIEGNIIVNSGTGTTRSDINLLMVPSGQEGEVVGTFIIRNNVLTDGDGTPIVVHAAYERLGADVSMLGNVVVAEREAQARGDEPAPQPEPEPEPEPEPTPETIEVETRLDLTSLSGGASRVEFSVDGAVETTMRLAARTILTEAEVAAIAIEISAARGDRAVSIGLDSGRLGVASSGESAAQQRQLSSSESLVFRFAESGGFEGAVGAELGLAGADRGEEIILEAFFDGVRVGRSVQDARGPVSFDQNVAFDQLTVRAGTGDAFSVDWIEATRLAVDDDGFLYG